MKTTRLELSKQLREAGYPQSSWFCWYQREDKKWNIANRESTELWFKTPEIYAAPTAEEILERLPEMLDSHCRMEIWKNKEGMLWNIAYNEVSHACGKPNNMGWQFDMSLAEAAGKMYLYLKEKGLLSE